MMHRLTVTFGDYDLLKETENQGLYYQNPYRYQRIYENR